MIIPILWHKCNNSNTNSLYCSFYYLFDISHLFFLLRKKAPMTIIPSNPMNTGKVLSPKFPSSKTTASTIKIAPTKNTIFWNIILHTLINTRTLYMLSALFFSLLVSPFLPPPFSLLLSQLLFSLLFLLLVSPLLPTLLMSRCKREKLFLVHLQFFRS